VVRNAAVQPDGARVVTRVDDTPERHLAARSNRPGCSDERQDYVCRAVVGAQPFTDEEDADPDPARGATTCAISVRSHGQLSLDYYWRDAGDFPATIDGGVAFADRPGFLPEG